MRAAETDTTAKVEALFRRRLMERSGIDRLRMACDMFDAATQLIAASLPPGVSNDPSARRIAILQRLYWPERDGPLITSAVAALRAIAAGTKRYADSAAD